METQGQRKCRILVVDDHPDMLESTRLLLQLLFYEVFTAKDGPTALETARAVSPDVVLLDLSMPKMDGYEVARRLREQPRGNQFALVAVSGYARREDVERSRLAGFDCHLIKPFAIEELQRFIAFKLGSPP
jgi:two-component system, chemotaxis family, CheB/CheR fusion protein